MTTVFLALMPIALIMTLGKFVAATKILSADGWIGLERITYFVLFPALIVSKLATADFEQIDWRMPVALVAAQICIAAISILVGNASKQPRERIGVFVQSGVRWNTFIALAIAQDLLGANGLALVAAAAAAMIPTANVLSILGLMHYSRQTTNFAKIIKSLAVNPLVLACLTGILMNILGLRLHASLNEVLDILAEATIALGLLTTGAAIQLTTRSVSVLGLSAWSLFRLLGLPIVAVAFAVWLRIPSEIVFVMLIATSVPTASNGTVLARQLGADATLAANLIASQTVLAIGTVTLVLWASMFIQ